MDAGGVGGVGPVGPVGGVGAGDGVGGGRDVSDWDD